MTIANYYGVTALSEPNEWLVDFISTNNPRPELVVLGRGAV